MRIETTPSTPLPATTAVAGAMRWKQGQILQALVIRADARRASATLDIGGKAVEVKSNAPLAPGQRIDIEVTKGGKSPGLRLLAIESPPEAATTAALRRVLPRQEGLAPLLAIVSRLATEAEGPAREAAARFLAALPHWRELTSARGLRQALARSGLFLEHHLARGEAPPEGDLKAALLQLLARLPAAEGRLLRPDLPPPRPGRHQPQGRAEMPAGPLSALFEALSGRAEGALARLTLLQLAALQPRQEEPPAWLFELPLRDDRQQADIFQFTVPRQRKNARGEAGHAVTLAFSLGGLGPVTVRVEFKDGAIATTWWAERSESTETIGRALGQLRERLREAGLTPGAMQCHHGAPPPPVTAHPPLLDVKV